MALREGKALYEVHGDGGPWSLRNGKESEWAKGFVVYGFGLFATGTGSYVFRDKSLELGPPVPPSDVLYGLPDTRMACQMVIMRHLEDQET